MPKHLDKAKACKNDEFYTFLDDIEKEIKHYTHHFKDKIVYCNCDNPKYSNFWKYFHINFSELGLKKLISTHYNPNEPSYIMEYNGGNDTDIMVGVKTPLKGNGDFRSDECIEILKSSDIIATNPPFSICRSDFVPLLFKYNKKFIFIASETMIGYRDIFPLLKDNKIWTGWNNVTRFLKNDGTIQKFGNICWYTNLTTSKNLKYIPITKKYNPTDYPTYDNYDGIEVSKLSDIPSDYNGIMGVPITFMKKYNPNQFEIVGFRKGNDGKDLTYTIERERERERESLSFQSYSYQKKIKSKKGK